MTSQDEETPLSLAALIERSFDIDADADAQGRRRSRRMREGGLCCFEQRATATLGASVAIGLVSGTLYGFGRYARALKELLELSQSEVQHFGVLLDFGSYVGHPLTGYIYDSFGPGVSSLSAAAMSFFAYAYIGAAVESYSQSTTTAASATKPIAALDASFFVVGFASGLCYIAALGSTTRVFKSTPHFGRAVGLVAASYGLCSTLVGWSFDAIVGSGLGLGYFFLFWACCTALVFTVGSCFLVREEDPEPNSSEEASSSTVGEIPGDGILESSSNIHTVYSIAATENRSANVERDNEPSFQGSVIQEHHSLESSSLSSWTTWRKLDFWILFASFACTTGAGLFVINNVSTMVQSLRGGDSFAGRLLLLLSFCNVIGRVSAGYLADRTRPSKTNAFRGVAMLMALAHLISASADGPGKGAQTRLVVTVALSLLAYGGSWVLVIAILSDRFGNVHFGKDYGLIAMGPAVSGMLMNTVGAWIYERHADADTGICIGLHCYQYSFAIASATAVVGCLLLSLISSR